MNRPDFSVVIPACNAAPHLAGALDSVRAQTHAAREVIVVDDGSSDETAAIARNWGAHVVSRENGGPAAARNAGVAIAGSPWIAFLDADERWDPGFLERVATAAALCPDVRAIFTWFAQDPLWRGVRRHRVAPGIARCDRHDLVAALVRSSRFISTSALVVRRDEFLRCGGFDAGLRSAEHLDLILRLFVISTAAVVDEPPSLYRRRGRALGAKEAGSGIWIRHVWDRVLEEPDRYPAGLDRLFGEAFGRRGLRRALIPPR